MTEFCKQCGQGVLIQIQRNTGFCTPRCEDRYDPFRGVDS